MSFYQELVKTSMEGQKIKLPARLKKFFDTGEYEKYNGKYVGNLPNDESDARVELNFGEENLTDLFDDHVNNEFANEGERFEILPLACMGMGGSQYMAVKLEDECPVYMWEHDDGTFTEHSSSLDEFLESLHDDEDDDETDNENVETGDWAKRAFNVSAGAVFGKGKSAGVGKPGEIPANYNPDSENPISAYRNVAGCSKEEMWDYMMFIDGWNWKKYKPQDWPCANMDFPDLDEDKKYDLWPYKPDLSKPHWVDLNNQHKSGVERKVLFEGKRKDYETPDQYVGKDAQKLVTEFERLIKDGDEAKIKAAGFKNLEHIKYVIAFTKKELSKVYAETDKVIGEAKAKLDKQMDANIASAKKGGLLDPINGVSMEDWAAANAKLAGGVPLPDILKVLGVEKPAWDEISAQWNTRMSQDTTFAITTVYGNAFVNSDIGKFAGTGSKGGGSAAGGAVDKVKNDFELYIKIMCHQSMGAIQGLDANAVLKKYGLNAADWGVVGAHWAPKMMSTEMAVKMSDLMTKYNDEFSKGAPAKAGDDIDY